MKSDLWPSVPVRRLGTVVGGGTPTAAPAHWDGDIPFVTPPDLRPVVGGIVRTTQRTLTSEGVAEGSSTVPKDSVILSIRAPIGYVARTASAVAFNQGCRAIVPFDGTSARYLTYALVAAGPELDSLGRGTTFMELSAVHMAALELPVPPLDEQRAIADYLDGETARIDTIIEEQQRLIEMLRERRRAVAMHAIQPMNETADKLSRTAHIGNGSTPRRDTTAYWDGGDVPWLNSSVVNENRVTSAEQFVTVTALNECHLPMVGPGSVLVGLTGQGKTRGMATILDIEAAVNQHIAYVAPDRNKWWPDYLLWSFTAAYDELRQISEENGSTRAALTCESLKQLRFADPPLDEQRRIAAHLDEQAAKIDTLIEESERFIKLSQERRAALITAAVTGQIDVREAA